MCLMLLRRFWLLYGLIDWALWELKEEESLLANCNVNYACIRFNMR